MVEIKTVRYECDRCGEPAPREADRPPCGDSRVERKGAHAFVRIEFSKWNYGGDSRETIELEDLCADCANAIAKWARQRPDPVTKKADND